MDLDIIYQDNHLLAVCKPAGLLVQGDRSGHVTLTDLVATYLKDKYNKPGNVYVGLVHRLDRNVSGVVLLARTSKAASRLSGQFRDKQVKKVYRAVATGRPPENEATVTAWLAVEGDRTGRTRASLTSFPEAREGQLHYKVLDTSGGYCHLEIKPITGRRHQIRAQMALLGCPLLGDVKYGSGERLPEHRIALHAYSLGIAHPVGGRLIRLDAPEPLDWPWPVD